MTVDNRLYKQAQQKLLQSIQRDAQQRLGHPVEFRRGATKWPDGQDLEGWLLVEVLWTVEFAGVTLWKHTGPPLVGIPRNFRAALSRDTRLDEVVKRHAESFCTEAGFDHRLFTLTLDG